METIGELTFEPICDKFTDDIKSKSMLPGSVLDKVIVHPSKCVITSNIKNHIQRIQHFKVYPDDIWLVGFPRSGTTWSQEMVWLLANNLDFGGAKSTPLTTRFPFLELEVYEPITVDTIDSIANLSRPRCIKSHLPVEMLPKEIWTIKPRIIHVSRDPRDVVISYYHFFRMRAGYDGTFDEFTESFLADRVDWAPFWTHVSNFYKLKNQGNILFNNYEEMKRDLSNIIKKTAHFMDIEVKDDDVERVKEHLSFNNMKDNLSCNQLDTTLMMQKLFKKQLDENSYFIRKGEPGGWKQTFSDYLIHKFDEWNEKHLKENGFDKYPWL